MRGLELLKEKAKRRSKKIPSVINGVMTRVSDPCSPLELAGHLGRGRLSEEDEADTETGHPSQGQSDGDGMLMKSTP